MRADAERNRVRLIDAAAEAFAEFGLEASVAEIARRAGVGQGTAFRRFPAKADLVAAVLADRLSALRERAQEAIEHPDPWEGLCQFMRAGAEMKARDRGFFEEAASGAALRDGGVRGCQCDLRELIERLLDRAQAAGAVRADVTPDDIPLLVGAAVHAAAPMLSVTPELWRRYLDVILAGLRPGAGGRLSVAAPTTEQVHGASDGLGH